MFDAKVPQRGGHRQHRSAAKQPARAQACATAQHVREQRLPRACVGAATEITVTSLARGDLWADAPVQAFWHSSGLRHLRRNERLKNCRKIATGIYPQVAKERYPSRSTPSQHMCVSCVYMAFGRLQPLGRPAGSPGAASKASLARNFAGARPSYCCIPILIA